MRGSLTFSFSFLLLVTFPLPVLLVVVREAELLASLMSLDRAKRSAIRRPCVLCFFIFRDCFSVAMLGFDLAKKLFREGQVTGLTDFFSSWLDNNR